VCVFVLLLDIIVYGATLQAAAAVGGLLANGVSPKRISFIRPGWVTPQLVEKEENRTPTVEAELKGNRRKSMNEMKESESKKDEDEFGEEFSDWVRLKGCFLGDERAENIMTDTLKSLGIYDRNDLELLGVSGSKGLNNNGTITSGGQGGGGGGVPSSSSSHASRSTANQRSRVTTGEDNDSIGGGSSSAFSSGIGGGYEEKDDLDVYDDNHSDFDGYHPSEEIQKVPISDIEMAVFQKMGTSETLSLSCSVLLTCHNLNIRWELKPSGICSICFFFMDVSFSLLTPSLIIIYPTLLSSSYLISLSCIYIYIYMYMYSFYLHVR